MPHADAAIERLAANHGASRRGEENDTNIQTVGYHEGSSAA
jgi:hypothetical protein